MGYSKRAVKEMELVDWDNEEGRTIKTVNGLGERREYRVLGKTAKGLYLCENEAGVKECFSEWDIGKIVIDEEEIERIDKEEGGRGKYKG